MRILAIDPSGTGTTGIFFTDDEKEENEFDSVNNALWQKHFEYLKNIVLVKQPQLIIYEHLQHLKVLSVHLTSLLKLIGAIEVLPYFLLTDCRVDKIPVQRVKEIYKKISNKEINLEPINKRNSFYFGKQKISLHQLDAYLLYHLWKQKKQLI